MGSGIQEKKGFRLMEWEAMFGLFVYAWFLNAFYNFGEYLTLVYGESAI